MNFVRIFILAVCLSGIGLVSGADETGIVATVGENAITTQDLVNRTKLIIISSGLKGDEETAKKIAPQVLQSLINERLQMQEAERLKIEITPDEINKAINSIEQQNKMKPGQLKEVLKKTSIPLNTLQTQVKGQIAWAKIRGKAIQPRISVTDEEVVDFAKTLAVKPTELEYHVNEIVLPVENVKDDAKMLILANKLADELRSGKAEFKKIAKQFSQSASAQTGGDVGWLGENQVPKELLSEIKKYGEGKIIGPVKSVEGYFILFIPETRVIDANSDQHIITLRQFEIPYKTPKEAKAAADKLKTITDQARGCTASAAYAKEKGAILEDYGSIQVKELAVPVRKVVYGLPTGEYSAPVNTGVSLLTFLICEKSSDVESADTTKNDKAREILFKRKVELEARKYMRDLRRDTNIEIKYGN